MHTVCHCAARIPPIRSHVFASIAAFLMVWVPRTADSSISESAMSPKVQMAWLVGPGKRQGEAATSCSPKKKQKVADATDSSPKKKPTAAAAAKADNCTKGSPKKKPKTAAAKQADTCTDGSPKKKPKAAAAGCPDAGHIEWPKKGTERSNKARTR